VVGGHLSEAELAGPLEELVDGEASLEDEVATVFDLLEEVTPAQGHRLALTPGELGAEHQRPVVEPIPNDGRAEAIGGQVAVDDYAVLATARADGRPEAAPVSYLVWRGAFWMALVAGARERNLCANPYASLVLMEGEGRQHRALIAEGPALLYDPQRMDGVGEGFAAVWAKRFREVPTWAAGLVELRPARLYSYDAT
jgi:hypothetical protein